MFLYAVSNMNALKILEIGCVPEAFWFSRLAASVCGLAKHGIAWHSDNCKATSWYPAVVQAGNSFVESNSADLSMGTWRCSIKKWPAYLQPVLDHQFWKDNTYTYTLPLMSRKIEPDNIWQPPQPRSTQVLSRPAMTPAGSGIAKTALCDSGVQKGWPVNYDRLCMAGMWVYSVLS